MNEFTARGVHKRAATVIVERFLAGESIVSLADDYELSREVVEATLRDAMAWGVSDRVPSEPKMVYRIADDLLAEAVRNAYFPSDVVVSRVFRDGDGTGDGDGAFVTLRLYAEEERVTLTYEEASRYPYANSLSLAHGRLAAANRALVSRLRRADR